MGQKDEGMLLRRVALAAGTRHHWCVICWSIRMMWIGLGLLFQAPICAAIDHWGMDLPGYPAWSVAGFLVGGGLVLGGMALAGIRTQKR